MAKIPFNVDAYTAKLIGRENVSKLDGAILELVKNTYDADATVCFIYYESSTRTVYIGDNGTGMTEDIIKNRWMTIGRSSKAVTYRSHKGRTQTGAKGIGRFALDRIADRCEMLTITTEEQLLWRVDWRDFEFGQDITSITAELDATSSSFSEFGTNIKNTALTNLLRTSFGGTGTIFKLFDLHDTWDAETLQSIKSNLKTLIPPEIKATFRIYFFEQETDLATADIIQDDGEFLFDYRIKFFVDVAGKVSVEIARDEFDFGSAFDTIQREAGFNNDDRRYFKGEPIVYNSTFVDIMGGRQPIENSIGDFSGVLYFAKVSASAKDREKYYYKDIVARQDMRERLGGIRIYRDGFRVRPYGDPNASSYDWLQLSSRKNKSPAAISHTSGAWRVNADQMFGSILISRTNITLPDQANRQGIVETPEFMVLQEFIRKILSLFEKDRQYVGRLLSQYYEKLHPIEVAQAEYDKKVQKSSSVKEDSSEKNPTTPVETMDIATVSRLIEHRQETIQSLETEVQMLRALATTGIVTNAYVHELNSVRHTLFMKVATAKEALENGDYSDALKAITGADNVRVSLASWFDVTIGSIRRDKRKLRLIDIEDLFQHILSSWQTILSAKNINLQLQVERIEFKCFPYEVEVVISNLVTNSIASFDGSKIPDKTIYINVCATEVGICISYSDNGAGLSSAYRKDPDKILTAHESDKTNSSGEVIGTGMGMWIINSIVLDYKGTIDLSGNETSNSGFFIKLYLNNR